MTLTPRESGPGSLLLPLMSLVSKIVLLAPNKAGWLLPDGSLALGASMKSFGNVLYV